jgi:hypothetical protein
MDRERWQEGKYDCDMVELCDLLREAVKRLKEVQYPAFIISEEGLSDELIQQARTVGYINHAYPVKTHKR